MTDKERRVRSRARSAKYYAAHRVEINARRKQDREQNPEKYKAERQRTYLKHADALRAKARVRSQAYVQQNRDVILAKRRSWWAANRDQARAALRARRKAQPNRARQYEITKYAKHSEKINARSRAWAKTHPWVGAAQTMRRYLAERQATPAWADQKSIKSFYKEAARLSAETGVPHDVDHIVPIRGKTVCGLHVQYNLQILTKYENVRKANRLLATVSDGASCVF